MRLCSACLLGIKCRYDGKGKPNEEVLAIAKNEVLIPVCPEQLGGQTTPRPNAEIKEIETQLNSILSEIDNSENENNELMREAHQIVLRNAQSKAA